MAWGLHRVAEGEPELNECFAGDDVATRDGTAVIGNPWHSLRGFVDSVIVGVQDRDWVESQFAGAVPVAESTGCRPYLEERAFR